MDKKYDRVILIWNLLKQTTNMGVVKDFLKKKDLASSATSWDELYEKRVAPAMERDDISEADLIDLLRTAEECGRQHIFLFKTDTDTAKELMDRDRVRAILNKSGIADVLDAPSILDQPDQATIVDVRWDTAHVDLRLIIKIIETRVSQQYVGESIDNGMLIRRYQYIRERAVHVARLHRNGLLEFRIGSHRNSTQYVGDIRRMWHMTNPILLEKDFNPLLLSKLKEKLWRDHKDLTGMIRYSDSLVKNEFGTAMKAVAGSEDSDLMDDKGAVDGVEVFLNADGSNAYVDSHNIWLRAEPYKLSKDMHILITGEVNEFAIPSHCSSGDYENALAAIRSLNR